MRRHHRPKASGEDAFEFLNGNPHRPETRLHVGNLPLQNTLSNGTFLQPESVGHLAHGEQLGTGSHTGTSSDVMWLTASCMYCYRHDQ